MKFMSGAAGSNSIAVAVPESPNKCAVAESNGETLRDSVSPTSNNPRFICPAETNCDISHKPYGYPEHPRFTSNAAHPVLKPSRCCSTHAVAGSE